jgi:hypothetical protein
MDCGKYAIFIYFRMNSMKIRDAIWLSIMFLFATCTSQRQAREAEREMDALKGVCAPLSTIVKDAENNFIHSRGEFVKGIDTGFIYIKSYYKPGIHIPPFRDMEMIYLVDSSEKDWIYMAVRQFEPTTHIRDIYNAFVKQVDFCFLSAEVEKKTRNDVIDGDYTQWVIIEKPALGTELRVNVDLHLKFYIRVLPQTSFYVLSMSIWKERTKT